MKMTASIGEEQLRELSQDLKLGESIPIYLEEINQFCAVVKVTEEQLQRVRGNIQLVVGPSYVEDHKTLLITVGDMENPELVVLGIPNNAQSKNALIKSSSNGIEFYFVTEGLTDFSIKKLLTSQFSQLAYGQVLDKM